MKQSDTSNKNDDRQLLRLIKLLAKSSQKGFAFSQVDNRVSFNWNHRTHTFDSLLLDHAKRKGLVLYSDQRLYVSDHGLEWLRAKLGVGLANEASATSSAPKHNDIKIPPRLNLNESPLARLARRSGSKREAYLEQSEVEAGERLRRDFETGKLQPSITARLDAGAGYSGKGMRFCAHEISDFAMDARGRVTKAVKFLGPELSGVALDICCFLKGLEKVERERQ